MTDETPTPLPVVPCGIFFAGERVLVTATVNPPIGDISALAVPDALWFDAEFIDSVWRRVPRLKGKPLCDTIAAIEAELRARVNFHHETTP